MTTALKYVHLDSSHRLAHDTSSRQTVHLSSHPIINCKRVGVLKASITNTGLNIMEGHDTFQIGVAVSGSGNDVPYVVTLRLKHGYYLLSELIGAMNAATSTYSDTVTDVTNAINSLTFVVNSGRVEIATSSLPKASGYVLISERLSSNANSIWRSLGFSSDQLTALSIWEAGGIFSEVKALSTGVIMQAPTDVKQAFRSRTATLYDFNFPAHHKAVIENDQGFFLASKVLTSGGNVLRSNVIDGVHSTQQSDHLVYMPNTSNRDEYMHYEADMIEWHEVNADVQHFDIELRNSNNVVFKVDRSNVASARYGNALPEYKLVLVFETHVPDNSQEVQGYKAEGYSKGHRF